VVGRSRRQERWLHEIEGRDGVDVGDHADGLVAVAVVTVLGVGGIGVITGYIDAAAAAGTVAVVVC
jgi:hypothetical protein